GAVLVPSPSFTGATKILPPPSFRSMRGWPCCMVRTTSAPSIFSNHCAMPSGLVVRIWTWSHVYCAMALFSLFLTVRRLGQDRSVAKRLRIAPGGTLCCWCGRLRKPASLADLEVQHLQDTLQFGALEHAARHVAADAVQFELVVLALLR